MKRRLLSLMLAMGSLPVAHAADIANGKALHDANCQKCHDNSIYTRPNSIIPTYSTLKNRVKFCDAAANTHFSESQLADVTAYLNHEFYKFKRP